MGATPDDPDAARLCRHWFGPTPVRARPIVGAGFSGCPVSLIDTGAWNVVGRSTAAGAVATRFILKAFSAGWPRSRATAVHRLLGRLRHAGMDEVPIPMPVAGSRDETIVEEADGRLWELLSFRPGEPVVAPNPGQSVAALSTLARLHRAATGLEGLFPAPPSEAVPPALFRRFEAIGRIRAEPWSRPAGRGGTPWQVAVEARRAAAAAILDRHGGDRVLARLGAATFPTVPLRLVLRDIWRAHLLFEGDRVSGIIDFHAAGIDTPATDLARLLGSWEPPDGSATGRRGLTEVWQRSLAAYESICPLSSGERRLIDFLHVGGVLGGLDHWFQLRHAPQAAGMTPLKTLERIDELVKSLDSALEWADAGDVGGD